MKPHRPCRLQGVEFLVWVCLVSYALSCWQDTGLDTDEVTTAVRNEFRVGIWRKQQSMLVPPEGCHTNSVFFTLLVPQDQPWTSTVNGQSVFFRKQLFVLCNLCWLLNCQMKCDAWCPKWIDSWLPGEEELILLVTRLSEVSGLVNSSLTRQVPEKDLGFSLKMNFWWNVFPPSGWYPNLLTFSLYFVSILVFLNP